MRWNVDGRATSIFFSFLRGMCSARSLTIILYFFPFFSSLKIKSHYLSTAVLLYNVNNTPPRIFTGLRVHYGERAWTRSKGRTAHYSDLIRIGAFFPRIFLGTSED